jgi:hypothetical protein
MKATKALKRLAKIEALISDVMERYSSSALHIREALQDAKAAFVRVKEAVSSQASSGTAKKKAAVKKAAVKTPTATTAKKSAPIKKAVKKRSAKKTVPAPLQTAPVSVQAATKPTAQVPIPVPKV